MPFIPDEDYKRITGQELVVSPNLYQMLTDDELINLALSDAITFRQIGRSKDAGEAYRSLLTQRQSATPPEHRVEPVERYVYQEPAKAENRSEGGENSTPKYNHNCPLCTFLGTFHEYDLYHCLRGYNSPTILARYGNHPCDYDFGIPLSNSPACLFEGLERAKQRNLRC